MNISFDILSIIYLVVLLIFLIIGLSKGFIKSIVSIAGWLISLVLSGLLNKPTTQLLVKGSLANSFKADLVTKFNSQGELFSQTYNAESFKAFADSKNLPEFVRNTVKGIIDFLQAGEGETISEVLSGAIVYYCFLVVTFILLFILFLIAFKIFAKLVSKIEDGSKAFKVVNRTLGAIVYVALALVLIGVVNYVFAFITIAGGNVANWLTDTMKLGTDTWTFSKFLYENNYLGEIISAIIDSLF